MAEKDVDPDWAVRVVTACQSGTKAEQAAAWDEMSRVLLPVITRLAKREQRKMGLNSLADDAAMEAFISLYSKIHSITDASGLGAWLARVVRNKLIDIAKKRRENPTDEVWAYDSPTPDGHRHDFSDLHQVIRALPMSSRVILHGRFWLEMSNEEIADLLLLPVGTVKSRTWELLNRTLPKALQDLDTQERHQR